MNQIELQIKEWLTSLGYVKGARVECKDRDEVGVLKEAYGIGLDEDGKIDYVVFVTEDKGEVHVIHNGQPQPIVPYPEMTPQEILEEYGVKVKIPQSL